MDQFEDPENERLLELGIICMSLLVAVVAVPWLAIARYAEMAKAAWRSVIALASMARSLGSAVRNRSTDAPIRIYLPSDKTSHRQVFADEVAATPAKKAA